MYDFKPGQGPQNLKKSQRVPQKTPQAVVPQKRFKLWSHKKNSAISDEVRYLWRFCGGVSKGQICTDSQIRDILGEKSFGNTKIQVFFTLVAGFYWA